MDDIFVEQIVKNGNPFKTTLLRIAIVGGSILFCLIILGIPVVGQYTFIFSMFVACTFVLFFWRRVDKEYEYSFTDGQLDVDVVFSRMGRKHLLSIDCKKFQLIAAAHEPRYQAIYNRKYDKVIDAGSGKITEKTYIAIAQSGEKNLKLVFEPNERMLDCLKKYNPHAVMTEGRTRPVSL